MTIVRTPVNNQVMRKAPKQMNSLSSLLSMSVPILLISTLLTSNLIFRTSRATWSLNSLFLTHANSAQLLSSFIPQPQSQLKSFQTVDSFQVLSNKLWKSSGKMDSSQMLKDLRTPCSLSRLFHLAQKWILIKWTSNLPRCSTPITWTSFSRPIICHQRSSSRTSTRARCKQCNKDKLNWCKTMRK